MRLSHLPPLMVAGDSVIVSSMFSVDPLSM